MKIIVDTCGGDQASSFIQGIANALQKIEDLQIVAYGDQAKIAAALKDQTFDRSRLEIVHATEEITNHEAPVTAIRTKKDASLVLAYQRLKTDDTCVGLISAGSTGAVITGACLLLGRIPGIERPTLLTLLPTVNGKKVCLTDCGANVDCRPSQLLQFAILGNAFMASAQNLANPRVALMSVGTEDAKGNAVTKETFGLLKDSNLNFVGNIEGKTLLSGDVDVVVCDGFVGNVTLKTIEAATSSAVKLFIGYLQQAATPDTNLSFVKTATQNFMTDYDFNQMASGVIIGTKKPVIKVHGSSHGGAVLHACQQMMQMVRGGLIEKINQHLTVPSETL